MEANTAINRQAYMNYLTNRVLLWQNAIEKKPEHNILLSSEHPGKRRKTGHKVENGELYNIADSMYNNLPSRLGSSSVQKSHTINPLKRTYPIDDLSMQMPISDDGVDIAVARSD